MKIVVCIKRVPDTEARIKIADDRTSTAKWAAQGITAQSFNSIGVDNFEVVDLTAEIPLTNNCVRNP